jgi:hypothetical protein
MVKTYKAVKISRGSNGWGGPLIIQPTEQRSKVVSVTGGGIHPLARQIAELTGAEAVDGFRSPPIESEMAVVVVDCGGTARCGVYPRKRIPTVNITPVGQSGPLAQFITEDIYVSGVKPENIILADGSAAAAPAAASIEEEAHQPVEQPSEGGLIGFISSIGRVMGRVVGIFFQAGRRTIDQVIRNVLPFMAFVTMLIGLILYTVLVTFSHSHSDHLPITLSVCWCSLQYVACHSCRRFWGLVRSSHRLSVWQLLDRRSQTAPLPRPWLCPRFLPTTRRSVATLYRLVWHSVKRNPRQSKLVFPLF